MKFVWRVEKCHLSRDDVNEIARLLQENEIFNTITDKNEGFFSALLLILFSYKYIRVTGQYHSKSDLSQPIVINLVSLIASCFY